MAKRVLTDEAFTRTQQQAKAAGSSTFRGEERRKQGLGLHDYVDPSKLGIIRRSLCRFEENGKHFVLPNGVAMAVENELDGTGSMGRINIDTALDKLKILYDLLFHGALKRYDPQLANGMFGDTDDECVLQRSQYEMDEQIAHQLTLMDVGVFDGHGNYKENPEYGLFGATFLTAADINRYGLKSYHFALSDEAIVLQLDPATIERVYGPTVWEALAENGQEVNRRNLPSTPEMVESMLKQRHAFFFKFAEKYKETTQTWRRCYGRERMIDIPRIEMLPYFEAAVIGLTEGVIDLQTVEEFLRQAKVNASDAAVITRAVAGIPLGAQAALPNFNKLPQKGAKFAKKRDLWPIGYDKNGDPVKGKSKAGKPDKEEEPDSMWL